MLENQSIYIVMSFTNTIPGRAIKIRAAMKFWNRYEGDTYSHVSISRDSKLGNMLSFARREINNPFNAGLVRENIREGLLAREPDKNKIAVIKLDISMEQYENVVKVTESYWKKRDKYSFNYVGLAAMLLYGKGVKLKNKFFCSQWIATILKESNINIFSGEKPENIRPFDFYGRLKDKIVYEGPIIDYPEYFDNNYKVYYKEDEQNTDNKNYHFVVTEINK